MNRRCMGFLLALGVLLTPLLAACASGSAGTGVSAREQLAFGVAMARRGLWNEALFRFQQVEAQGGASARMLNNLAVAYEATGQFDEALATYQRAIRVAPGDAAIQRNFTRFSQFYESFRPRESAGARREGDVEAVKQGGEDAAAGIPAAPAPAPGAVPEATPEPTPEPEPAPAPEPEPEAPAVPDDPATPVRETMPEAAPEPPAPMADSGDAA